MTPNEKQFFRKRKVSLKGESTVTQAVSKISNEVAIAGEDLGLGLDGFKPTRPSMAKIKIIHPKGMFEITEKDGTKKLVKELKDIVFLDVSSGRIMWNPESDPGSGEWVCRSRDGDQPESGGKFEGPCETCPNSKWGPKVNGKSKKPLCDETVNVIFGRKDGDPVLTSFSRTSLKPIRDFLTVNFVNERRPLYVRYVNLSLREETFGNTATIYQIIVPELGAVLSANDQKDAYAAARAVKGMSSVNPDDLNTPNNGEDQEKAEKTEKTESKTIEVQAKPANKNRLQRFSELAKKNGISLADVIKASKEVFNAGLPQLTDGQADLLALSLEVETEITDLVTLLQENVQVELAEVTSDMVQMLRELLG